MKSIQLSPSKYGQFYVKVDDEDFEWLNQWKWSVLKNKKTFYAARHLPTTSDKKRPSIKMHRLILGLINPKEETDHIDFDGLNNQRQNIRKATPSQNRANRRKIANKTSKYLGVYKRSSSKKWRATIGSNGKRKNLGIYFNEIDAALAYNKAAIEIHGEFANLNIISL